jgi:cytochrome c-type biogenesis protein CcmH/NrfG
MKRAFILLSASLALSLPAVTASAQTGAARGKVVDEQGQPIEGAKVELDYKGGVTRKFETKTNKKGEFTQVGLQSGLYDITVTKEGYQPGLTGSRISLGDPTYLKDIQLKKGGAGAASGAAGDGGAAALQASFKAALELTQAGKLDEAEAAYKDLLTKVPSIPEIHYNLAYVYSQKKDWTNAEASFKKALELKPDYSDALTSLARMYQESGQQDKAMAIMSQGSASTDPKAQFNLGVMLMNQNKDEEALAAFKKSVELDPANAEAYFFIGTRSLQLGKLPEAVAALEKYISLNPSNAANLSTAKQMLPALKAALPKK